MKNLRISHVTNKNYSFNSEYYVVEEKKTFLKFFTFWKKCKFAISHFEEERYFVPYTFESVKKAKEFIQEKYENFSLSEKISYKTIPDGFEY